MQQLMTNVNGQKCHYTLEMVISPLRYALRLLEDAGVFGPDRLSPANFITLGTPHLGTLKVRGCYRCNPQGMGLNIPVYDLIANLTHCSQWGMFLFHPPEIGDGIVTFPRYSWIESIGYRVCLITFVSSRGVRCTAFSSRQSDGGMVGRMLDNETGEQLCFKDTDMQR